MSSQSNSFNLSAVETAIASTQFAGQLHHLAITPSTNDLALEAAQAGGRVGVWIADRQIAGRGRGSHIWHSPAGPKDAAAGLYMTSLIAPPIPMQSALGLSLRAAIAVQSAIATVAGFERPSQIDIRWPNDLMLNGKKCGGILIDTASNPATPTQPATLRYAIVGIGINLNQTAFPPELNSIATSLRRELPQPAAIFREPLAAAILIALDAEVRALTSDRELSPSNLAEHSTWIAGKRVRVEARDGVPGYTGTTAGLDSQGFLLVHGDDRHLHTVLSGGLREP